MDSTVTHMACMWVLGGVATVRVEGAVGGWGQGEVGGGWRVGPGGSWWGVAGGARGKLVGGGGWGQGEIGGAHLSLCDKRASEALERWLQLMLPMGT